MLLYFFSIHGAQKAIARTVGRVAAKLGQTKRGERMGKEQQIALLQVGSPPISRVLSRGFGPGAVIPLDPPLPMGSSSLPGSSASHAIASLFGLAPDGVYRAGPVTRPAVGSYPTVSPLPDPRTGPSAVSSLWHSPSPCGARPLAGILLCGARTFLPNPEWVAATAWQTSQVRFYRGCLAGVNRIWPSWFVKVPTSPMRRAGSGVCHT